MPDVDGNHPWEEYSLDPVHRKPFIWRHRPTSTSLVDEEGFVSSFPSNLCLRYRFLDPSSLEYKVLYVRDPELSWAEIATAKDTGVVPIHYVPELGDDGVVHGPMTREWFLDMASQFEVTAGGELLREGLEVFQQIEDFEWKVFVMLPVTLGVDEVPLHRYTPKRLTSLVRTSFKE